jgi:hypothetical protein
MIVILTDDYNFFVDKILISVLVQLFLLDHKLFLLSRHNTPGLANPDKITISGFFSHWTSISKVENNSPL